MDGRLLTHQADYGSGLISSDSGLVIKQDYSGKRLYKYPGERLGFLGGWMHELSGVK